MKVGIIGMGAVGAACALSLVLRGSAREIVLIDRTRARAKAVATDLRYGAPLSPVTEITDGDYPDLAGAALVMITSGVNEKTGGATDRGDKSGRLRLLLPNAAIYREMVPQIVKVAPQAVLLTVTDPPDPLADIARDLAGHELVLSTGTFLDSLRLRVHLGRFFGVSPQSVEAQILGEHGTSEVFLWSGVRIAGVALDAALAERGTDAAEFRERIEHEVRYANITIIEGNNASQYGIGMVSARIAEIVLRDEHAVLPIGSYNPAYGVTLSLPSVLGRRGVEKILTPVMSQAERDALQKSAETLRQALDQARTA